MDVPETFLHAHSKPIRAIPRNSKTKLSVDARQSPATLFPMFRPQIAACLLLAAPILTSCKDKIPASSNAPNAPASVANSANGAPQAQSAKPAAHGLVIDGEHFVAHTVSDPQQGGLAVGVFTAPDTWKVDSQVVWNYAHTTVPVAISLQVENPANAEALFDYPTWDFFCLRPDGTYYQPGQNYGGLIFAHQQETPARTLGYYVQQLRGHEPQFKIVGSKDLPDLPAALKLPPAENQHGIAVKAAYEFNGQPVDEEFYAVYYSVNIPYDGPQGRTWQINWGLFYLHSFRAPAGTLDRRRPVFAAIVKSFRPNPAWQDRRKAIQAYLADQFNRQLQAGYDSIAAAGRLSKQISANSDAFLASVDHQLAASRASGASSAATTEPRSSTDKFDDYVRGVDTTDDPYYGTSQHSSTEQYHWTDGYGNYRNSNDASYDPNHAETGDWQLMQNSQ